MTMTQNDRLLLNAYIDGELDPAHVLEFERRLAEDRALADERRRIEALRAVARGSRSHMAPRRASMRLRSSASAGLSASRRSNSSACAGSSSPSI